MKRPISALLALFLFAAAALPAQDAKPAQQAGPPPLKFKVGDTVPDFTLKYFDGAGMKDFALHDYKGKKNVLVAFFIFAFTGGWTQQMKNLQAHLPELEADTQVVGVSMDSPFANKAFADKEGISFPIASDWFNNGSVTKEIFGIYNEKYKAARRVNYLIGKDGKVLAIQEDKDAVDPTKLVDACMARRLKQ